MKNEIINAAVIIGASALAGVLGFGLNGYFRDKGWSTWKAGAVTGLVGGGLGVGVALIGQKVNFFSGMGQLPKAYPTPLRMVPKQVTAATLRGVCAGCR